MKLFNVLLGVSVGIISLQSSAWAKEIEACKKESKASQKIFTEIANVEKSSRTFQDFQVPEIDYAKIDQVVAEKLKIFENEDLKIQKLTARVPDYKAANAGLKTAITDGLETYLMAMQEIRDDITKVVGPYYSRIKALREAAANDNTGVLKKALEEEQRRLTAAVRDLQNRNQERYNNAQNALMLSGLLNESNLAERSSYYGLRLADTKGVPYLSKSDILRSTHFNSELKVEREHYSDSAVRVEYKTNALFENNGVSKQIKCFSADRGVYLTSKSKDHDINSDVNVLAKIEQLKIDSKSECEEKILSLFGNLNPLSGCKSVACVELLSKDIADWQEYAAKFNQDLDLDKILDGENSFIQKKSFWLSSPKEVPNKPIIAGALLKFAERQFKKPTITPNKENTVIEIGGSVLTKAAGVSAGMAAGLLAAPALILDTVGIGLAKFDKLLDTRLVSLSLDLKMKEINGIEENQKFKNAKKEYMAILPTAYFESAGSSQDILFGLNEESCGAVTSSNTIKSEALFMAASQEQSGSIKNAR